MRLTLKAVNDELGKRGYTTRLAKGGGYFYFQFGEAEDWLDRTVNVATVNSLTLAEWTAELERLKKLNAEIMGAKRGSRRPNPNSRRASDERHLGNLRFQLLN